MPAACVSTTHFRKLMRCSCVCARTCAMCVCVLRCKHMYQLRVSTLQNGHCCRKLVAKADQAHPQKPHTPLSARRPQAHPARWGDQAPPRVQSCVGCEVCLLLVDCRFISRVTQSAGRQASLIPCQQLRDALQLATYSVRPGHTGGCQVLLPQQHAQTLAHSARHTQHTAHTAQNTLTACGAATGGCPAPPPQPPAAAAGCQDPHRLTPSQSRLTQNPLPLVASRL